MLCTYGADDVERVSCDSGGESSDTSARKGRERAGACGRTAPPDASVVHMELNAGVAHPQEHRGQTDDMIKHENTRKLTACTCPSTVQSHPPGVAPRNQVSCAQ